MVRFSVGSQLGALIWATAQMAKPGRPPEEETDRESRTGQESARDWTAEQSRRVMGEETPRARAWAQVSLCGEWQSQDSQPRQDDFKIPVSVPQVGWAPGTSVH